jgi:hypothetical protein
MITNTYRSLEINVYRNINNVNMILILYGNTGGTILYCSSLLTTASERLSETHAVTKLAFMLTSLHPRSNGFSSSIPFPTTGDGQSTKHQFYQQQQRLERLML